MTWHVVLVHRCSCCSSPSSASPSSSSPAATPRWSMARGGVEYGRRPLPVDGRPAHRAAGRLPARGAAGRPAVRPALGWPMLALVARARRRCAGGASRTLGPQWNTRVIVVPGPAAGAAGPTGWLRAPQLRRRGRRGLALPLVHTRVAHRARLHRAQRGCCWPCGSACENAALARASAAPPRRRGRDARRDRPAGRRRRARPGWPPPSTPRWPGWTAVVVEPRAGPGRQGVRRGPDAQRRGARCAALGVGVEGRPLRGIRYSTGAHRPRRAFRAAPGWACAGPALHAALRRPGAPSSASRSRPTARSAERPAGPRTRVEAARAAARAGWLVAADGLHSPTARARLGLDLPGRAPRRGTGCAGTTGRAVDGLRRGALGAARRGVRDAGRRRPGRRRRARAASGAATTTHLARLPRAARPARRGTGRDRGARRRAAAAAGARAGWPAGSCWSATPPATSTRSPARASRWRCVGPRPGRAACWPAARRSTSGAWRRLSRRYRLLTGALVAGPAATRPRRG